MGWSNATKFAGRSLVRGVKTSMRWGSTAFIEDSIETRWFTRANTLSGSALTIISICVGWWGEGEGGGDL
jgi:hypothetical protein